MSNMQLFYNGRHGSIGYSPEIKMFVGTIVDNKKTISYQGKTLFELNKDFRKQIDSLDTN